ncbi:MAG: hypothetical protein HYX74_04730 [Acidobacteria bacterium]|nr:hypothetical protein [Acidobacteriota bacterium]
MAETKPRFNPKSKQVNDVQTLAEIYCRQVVPFKTRKILLPGRKCAARIMYTFLGYEVKAGRKRMLCPDRVTARYLRIFSEVGMKEILIPYDPTRTSRLIDQLEQDFERLKQSVDMAELADEFARLRRSLTACQNRSGF